LGHSARRAAAAERGGGGHENTINPMARWIGVLREFKLLMDQDSAFVDGSDGSLGLLKDPMQLKFEPWSNDFGKVPMAQEPEDTLKKDQMKQNNLVKTPQILPSTQPTVLNSVVSPVPLASLASLSLGTSTLSQDKGGIPQAVPKLSLAQLASQNAKSGITSTQGSTLSSLQALRSNLSTQSTLPATSNMSTGSGLPKLSSITGSGLPSLRFLASNLPTQSQINKPIMSSTEMEVDPIAPSAPSKSESSLCANPSSLASFLSPCSASTAAFLKENSKLRSLNLPPVLDLQKSTQGKSGFDFNGPSPDEKRAQAAGTGKKGKTSRI
jgi:hypothetical protein